MIGLQKFKDFLRDINHYRKLRRAIRKNRGTADWERFKLRTDWVGRIYTVFNPLPADKGDDDFVLQTKLGERMIPCHKYISDIGLSEIVGVSGEKIPDSDSYLVVYYPIFKYITTWRMVRNTIILALFIYFITEIIHFFTWIGNLLEPVIYKLYKLF